ncbi:KN motif and ankyrin repeat domain-containing protein 1 [Nephila pilipes]|uniref:KN motif and ankyrin repeat domain-containing protein 1 n=1 Tax=Nephila pilipes TaxID=299642 RepID=A0A8X6TXW0_NEPPI|nr:KN motif and ankyrin repeat domain-containing protein 1 [Nephila pilipes]
MEPEIHDTNSIKVKHDMSSCELSDLLNNHVTVPKPMISRLSLDISSIIESQNEKFLSRENERQLAYSNATTPDPPSPNYSELIENWRAPIPVLLNPHTGYGNVTKIEALHGCNSLHPSFGKLLEGSLISNLIFNPNCDSLKKHLRLLGNKAECTSTYVKEDSSSKCSQTENTLFWKTSDFIKEFLESTTNTDLLNIKPTFPRISFSNQFTQTDIKSKSTSSQTKFCPSFVIDGSHDSSQIKGNVNIEKIMDSEIDSLCKTWIFDDTMRIINNLQIALSSPITKRSKVNEKSLEPLIFDSTNEDFRFNNFQETKASNVESEYLITDDVNGHETLSTNLMDDLIREENFQTRSWISEYSKALSQQSNQKFEQSHQEHNWSFPNYVIDKTYFKKEPQTISNSITPFPPDDIIIPKETFLQSFRILSTGMETVSAEVCFGSDVHKTEKASPLKVTTACEFSATTIDIVPTLPNHPIINPISIKLVRNELRKKDQCQTRIKNEVESKTFLNSCQEFNNESEEINMINEMDSIKKTLRVSKSIIFCRSSPIEPHSVNDIAIGLCDDCFAKTQETVAEKIKSENLLMSPERKDSFTSLYKETLLYTDGDQHFKCEENGEEIHSSISKTLKLEDLSLYCEAVNNHLLNLKHVDTDLLKDAVEVLNQKWLKVLSDKNSKKKDVHYYLNYFQTFSDNLLKMLMYSTDREGNNALHLALGNNKFDIADELLSYECGSELLNQKNKLGYSPLMICSISHPESDHDWNVVQNVLNLGNVNDASKFSKQTPLMSAASKGCVKMVRLLLEVGAHPNQQDEDGSTALMYAAVHGNEPCVCLLLENPKCDPRIKDNDHETACSIALNAGHKNAALLIYLHIKGRNKTSKAGL